MKQMKVSSVRLLLHFGAGYNYFAEGTEIRGYDEIEKRITSA